MEASAREGVLLERYRYPPSPPEALPGHSHERYQFGMGLGLRSAYEYRYRGARHRVPYGLLTAIHPGEVHSSGDVEDRRGPATFLAAYLDPALLLDAAEQAGRSGGALPFFGGPALADRDLAGLFVGLHAALEGPLEGPAPRLEQDSLLLSVLTRLVLRHADAPPSPPGPAGKERRAVRLAREYLRENPAENVSLGELSRIANLSPNYLSRVFSREVGLPPHRYQIQARVERAKVLLAEGTPVAEVARQTGFADHSHFARRFRRLVGVPPGRYAAEKRRG